MRKLMNKIFVEFSDGERHEVETDEFILLIKSQKNDIDCISHSSDKFVLDCVACMPSVLKG